jgi:flagellar basal body-associated protein FliL
MADKTNTNDSDPYVDIDPDFNNSVEVVERKDADDQVSLKKIIILLFLFIIIITGGLAGVYYVFYGTSSEMVADNWHAPIVTTTTSTTIPQTIPSMSLSTTLPASMTLSVNQQSLTNSDLQLLTSTGSLYSSTGTIYSLTNYGANNAQPSLTTNISDTQISLTELSLNSSSSVTELTLNTVSIESGLTESIKIVRKTINNPLAPLTPNLRNTPVLYRYKIASEIDELTETTDEVAVESTDQPTDTTETKSETASLTKTDKKARKEVAQVPLANRRKPIVYRAAIPLTLMYPELTLNFNSFIVLLPEAETKTYVDISVSVKTSNEKVFKEIQDRKTFVRGAIYAILKRIFESNNRQYISGDDIKKKIAKDINYILINGTIDNVFITNYLTI